LAPNKFQERPSGASRTQENLPAAAEGCGSLQYSPTPQLVRRGAGFPLPEDSTPLSAL